MSFTPNHLSQQDPRWKDEQLGFDDTLTIGTDGCALTCLAMLVNGYGFNETPDTLNQKLKAMGPGAGFMGGLIVWGSLSRAFPGIAYQDIILWDNPPADIASIDAALQAGQPVVIEIDRSPAPGLQNHWVVVYGKQGGDYLMLDPWSYPPDSQPVTLIGRYGFGRAPQDFVKAAVWYQVQGTAVPSTPPAGGGFYVRVPLNLSSGLNLRSAPSVSGNLVANEPAGSWLKVLEAASAAQAKIGIQDRWLNVQDTRQNNGYVAAWYVQASGQPIPPDPQTAPAPAPVPVTPPPSTPSQLSVLVSSQASAGLRLREQPNVTSNTLAVLMPGTSLAVLEPAAAAQPKIGVQGQWLNVRAPGGQTGYVAAWLVVQASSSPASSSFPAQTPVTTTPSPAPTPASAPTLTVLVSSQASAGLRLRDQPNTNGGLLKVLMPGTTLTVLEAAAAARTKIGVSGQWLNVREPGGKTGYVAAWYVQ